MRDFKELSFQELVLLALEKGLMIHGSGPAEEGTHSVMVTATTKKKIVVYAASNDADHATAVRTALESAITRADSKVIGIVKK